MTSVKFQLGAQELHRYWITTLEGPLDAQDLLTCKGNGLN